MYLEIMVTLKYTNKVTILEYLCKYTMAKLGLWTMGLDFALDYGLDF